MSTGGDVTFTITATNLSAPTDPFLLTELFDNVYGDLTVMVEPGYKPQTSTTCALPQLIAPGATYTCTFGAYFDALAPHTTLTEIDTVDAGGTDDEGTYYGGEDSAIVTQSPPIAVTDSSLCTFDTNPGLAERQFNRLLTQDAQSMPFYRLTATNPGQFFYNLSLSGAPGSTAHIKLVIPWPFVTQGARPIHVYDSVEVVPKPGGNFCLAPGNTTAAIDKYIVLSDYGIPIGDTGYDAATKTSTATSTVEFDVVIPSTGFAYVNQHLDDGLKGPQVDQNGDGIVDALRYGKDGGDNALWPPTNLIVIPQNSKHSFAVYKDSLLLGDDSVRNDNDFKKNPGVAGRITVGPTWSGTPIVGQTLRLKLGSIVVATAQTDSDGWYQFLYKHTGKAADYTVELVPPFAPSASSGSVPVTLKANGFAEVDFVF